MIRGRAPTLPWDGMAFRHGIARPRAERLIPGSRKTMTIPAGAIRLIGVTASLTESVSRLKECAKMPKIP